VPTVATLKSKYIALRRYRGPEDPVVRHARGQLDTAMLEQEIRARGSSLNSAQRERLVTLIRRGGRDG